MTQTLHDRIAQHITEYDAQGIHRTGTAVDQRSAEWLAAKIEEFGLVPHLPEFTFNRVDVQQAEIVVGDQRLVGVPLFDCAAYTDRGGITGNLGDIKNNSADIGVSVVPPWPGHEYTKNFNEARRSRRFKAMVSVTIGPSKGLFLLNADDFNEPFGPPVLQVSSRDGAWMKQATEEGVDAKVVAQATRTEASAMNVETRIHGIDPSLPPLMIITPRSGWWECASERGGGIAAWLEMMRAFAEKKPGRDVIFTANTGHELHHLGMNYFLDSNPQLLERAFAWIHLGANFAAQENDVTVISSDEELKEKLLRSVEGVDITASVGRPFGEAIPIHEHGGRFISIGGTNPLFHDPRDRWSEAVNMDQTTRITRGLMAFSQKLAEK